MEKTAVKKLAYQYQKDHPYTEEELVQMVLYCQTGNDKEKKNEYMSVLYWYYIADVYYAVSCVYLTIESCIDEEDLMGEAIVSLFEAIRLYRADRNTSLRTFVSQVSMRRLKRYASRNGRRIRLPVDFSKKLSQYQKFYSSYQMEHGKEPARKDIQEALQFRDSDMDRLEMYNGLSYVAVDTGDTEVKEPGAVTIPDENSSFEEEIDERVVKEALRKAVREEIRKVLKPEEQKILCYRNGIGCESHSLKETAEHFGRTENDILGEELIIREKLKASHGMKRLKKNML